MDLTNQAIAEALKEILTEIRQMQADIAELRKKKKPAKDEAEIKPETNIDISYFHDRELDDTFKKFMEYRKHDKHNAMGARSIKMTVACLNKFTVEEAKAALEEAMRNGYTGVFPKRTINSNNQSKVKEWGQA